MLRCFLIVMIGGLLALLLGCHKAETQAFPSTLDLPGTPPQITALVIKRLSDNQVWVHNQVRANTRFIPASTSKIPHTLIALETQTAAPDTIFKWDGTERSFKMWNQDQTFTQAYQRSAVWVYQEITQTLGPDVMTDWLTRFNYGNHDIGAAEDVTAYWLRGPLEISAHEQVGFLTRLANMDLPLSSQTYEAAWPMFENEVKGGHKLYAKTGWMYDPDAMDIGWFVGWVETGAANETYVFALNMDMPDKGDVRKRKPIVMDALVSIGAWPE